MRTCQCPALPGDDCPLTPLQCATRSAQWVVAPERLAGDDVKSLPDERLLSQAEAEAQQAAQNLQFGWVPNRIEYKSPSPEQIALLQNLQNAAQATNARTEPCDMRKRPFGQVADGHGVDIANEIPVTAEMIHEGHRVASAGYELDAIYRAMAALAPKRTLEWDDIAELDRRLLAKDVRIDRLKAELSDLEATNTLALSKIAELEPRILHLEAERAAWKHLYEATQFGDPAAPDLPDPPRRPDGTLAPQPKPLPVLKTQEPSRRVGG